MTRRAKYVSDMEIDEISLVDRPANQHALVTIAKRRGPEEDEVPESNDFYDIDGNVVDEDALQLGDHVFDAEGVEYVVSEDDEADDRELAGVSKAFSGAPADSLSASILEELSKAVTESDKNAVLSKALGQVADLSKRLEDAERLAKSERDLRLEREYISKAAEYNVPIPAADLGPVLMRMADAMSFEDCSVIHKALTAAGEMLFQEAGFSGSATEADPMRELEATLSKSAEGNLPAAMDDFFEKNPSAYDAYIKSNGR